ncbi:hypothetical protein [Endozoicomonas sp.]|uniref:hypothetical protein n=1 Tax=Endozoicomonas sp. TaxID=1892382 RepID=UPI002883D2C8|nr:hypothetical protein [Endozoicomonas sp.]
MNPVEIARFGLFQRIDQDGWYEKDNQLVTPSGEVAYVDNQGMVRTVQKAKPHQVEWIKNALEIAREHFKDKLFANNVESMNQRSIRRRGESHNLLGAQVFDDDLDDEAMEAMIEDLAARFASQDRFQSSAKLKDLRQPLGEKVDRTFLSDIRKLKIMFTKDISVLDEVRTTMVRHVLKDLLEYGFVRLATAEEFKDKFNYIESENMNNDSGEIIAYQTEIGEGRVKIHFIKADDFLKSLHTAETDGSANLYRFNCFEQPDKCIALAESKEDKAIPGKGAVKFK